MPLESPENDKRVLEFPRDARLAEYGAYAFFVVCVAIYPWLRIHYDLIYSVPELILKTALFWGLAIFLIHRLIFSSHWLRIRLFASENGITVETPGKETLRCSWEDLVGISPAKKTLYFKDNVRVRLDIAYPRLPLKRLKEFLHGLDGASIVLTAFLEHNTARKSRKMWFSLFLLNALLMALLIAVVVGVVVFCSSVHTSESFDRLIDVFIDVFFPVFILFFLGMNFFIIYVATAEFRRVDKKYRNWRSEPR